MIDRIENIAKLIIAKAEPKELANFLISDLKELMRMAEKLKQTGSEEDVKKIKSKLQVLLTNF
jgi:hypothetical protein